jgi:hypothetical protein
VYEIADNHMYLYNKKKSKALAAMTGERNDLIGSRSVLLAQKYKQKKSEEDVTFDDVLMDVPVEELDQVKPNSVIIYRREHLCDIFEELLERRELCAKTKIYNGRIISMQYRDGIRMYANEDFEIVKKACLTLTPNNKKISFSNQRLQKLTLDIFRAMYPRHRKCQLNTIVEQIMKGDDFRCTALIANDEAFIDQHRAKLEEKDYKKLDICKCYSSILLKTKHAYPLYTIFDQVEPYDGEGTDRVGWYYVTDLKQPGDWQFLPSKGWMDHGALHDLRERHGVTFHVTYQLLPSYALPCEYYKPFVSYIFKHFGKKAKNMLNPFTGMMNRHQSTVQRSYYTTDWKQVQGKFNDKEGEFVDNNDYFVRKREVDKDFTLYELMWEQKWEMSDFEISTYYCIIQRGWVALMDMMKDVERWGGRVFRLKCDCVFYTENITLPVKECHCGSCTKCVGTYRREELSLNQLEQKSIFKKMYDPQRREEDAQYDPVPTWKVNVKEDDIIVGDLDRKEWASQISDFIMKLGGGILLQGEGGHGKTTVLSCLYDKWVTEKKRCAVLAPTNAAAMNILKAMLADGVTIPEEDKWAVGTTLHKFMGVDPENIEVSNSRWNNIGSFDYIFVDEYTMVSDTMWHLLYQLHKKQNVKFIIAGDYHQLPDIMDAGSVRSDYEKRNTSGMREMCDYNTMELTVNKRSSNDMKELSLQAYEGNCPHEDIPFAHTLEVNLCWLNSTRKFVNRLCMDRIVKELGERVDGVYVIVPRCISKDTKNGGHMVVDDKTQLLRLTLGAPIICHRFNKKMNVFNNERFHVTDWEDTEIEITSDIFEDKVLRVPIIYFQKHFLVNYCMTTHKAQGISIDEPYAIWDMGHMLRSPQTLHCGKRKMLYTALTRTTNIDYVHQAHIGCHLPNVAKPFPFTDVLAISRRIEGYKEQDAQGHRECTLTVEDVLTIWDTWEGRCCHCGKRCSPERSVGSPLRLWTLDRINNQLGHCLRNVQLACFKCNSKRINVVV